MSDWWLLLLAAPVLIPLLMDAFGKSDKRPWYAVLGQAALWFAGAAAVLWLLVVVFQALGLDK